MSFFDPLCHALSKGSDAYEALLAEKERLALKAEPFEIVKENGTDALGPYEFGTEYYKLAPNKNVGYLRLKPGVKEMFLPSAVTTMYVALDMTEWTNDLRVTDASGNYMSTPIGPNAASRLILPETLPFRVNKDGTTSNQGPTVGGSPGVGLYLPKYTSAPANSGWYAGNVSTSITEQFVVAPKDMEAQVHLHKFTKMSAETIVAILENLADVNDREDTYTLTLGDTNLAKLTDEQKNIAYAKGWSLA